MKSVIKRLWCNSIAFQNTVSYDCTFNFELDHGLGKSPLAGNLHWSIVTILFLIIYFVLLERHVNSLEFVSTPYF